MPNNPTPEERAERHRALRKAVALMPTPNNHTAPEREKREEITLRCKDHPEANGRKPQPGDQGYKLRFPLESGTTLVLYCGPQTFTEFQDLIGRMMIDDAAQEPTQ